MYTQYQQNLNQSASQSANARNEAMDQLLNKYRFEEKQELTEAEDKKTHDLETTIPLGVEFLREGISSEPMKLFGKKVLSNALKMGIKTAKSSELLKGGNIESILNESGNIYKNIEDKGVSAALDALVEKHGPAIRALYDTKSEAVKAFGDRMTGQLLDKFDEGTAKIGKAVGESYDEALAASKVVAADTAEQVTSGINESGFGADTAIGALRRGVRDVDTVRTTVGNLFKPKVSAARNNVLDDALDADDYYEPTVMDQWMNDIRQQRLANPIEQAEPKSILKQFTEDAGARIRDDADRLASRYSRLKAGISDKLARPVQAGETELTDFSKKITDDIDSNVAELSTDELEARIKARFEDLQRESSQFIDSIHGENVITGRKADQPARPFDRIAEPEAPAEEGAGAGAEAEEAAAPAEEAAAPAEEAAAPAVEAVEEGETTFNPLQAFQSKIASSIESAGYDRLTDPANRWDYNRADPFKLQKFEGSYSSNTPIRTAVNEAIDAGEADELAPTLLIKDHPFSMMKALGEGARKARLQISKDALTKQFEAKKAISDSRTPAQRGLADIWAEDDEPSAKSGFADLWADDDDDELFSSAIKGSTIKPLFEHNYSGTTNIDDLWGSSTTEYMNPLRDSTNQPMEDLLRRAGVDFNQPIAKIAQQPEAHAAIADAVQEAAPVEAAAEVAPEAAEEGITVGGRFFKKPPRVPTQEEYEALVSKMRRTGSASLNADLEAGDPSGVLEEQSNAMKVVRDRYRPQSTVKSLEEIKEDYRAAVRKMRAPRTTEPTGEGFGEELPEPLMIEDKPSAEALKYWEKPSYAPFAAEETVDVDDVGLTGLTGLRDLQQLSSGVPELPIKSIVPLDQLTARIGQEATGPRLMLQDLPPAQAPPAQAPPSEAPAAEAPAAEAPAAEASAVVPEIEEGAGAASTVAEDVADTGAKSFFSQLFEGSIVADAADAEIPGLDLITGAVTAAAGVGTLLSGIFEKTNASLPDIPQALKISGVTSTFGA